ncbi:ABC transporter ATP-binding protein [Amycolatopsis pigmentata]|uniref:ABC transporter ATP-binding protein n=1 Tax=Amycolatopsis pigmentata TaxID=450801 RepID=A0ABW5FQT1_9PSEU
MPEPETVVRATGLVKRFPVTRSLFGRPLQTVRAVDGVDLEVQAGTTLGIVGESGSGKTTVGQLIARLQEPDEGTIEVEGVDVTRARGRALKLVRERLQFIFQDPYGALDPTKTVGHAVAEPLVVHRRISGREMNAHAGPLLERVALDPEFASRRPDELSGGQRQRVCIARALALSPSVLVADEPTSALDLSTRSEILNLLLDIQEESGQAVVLISHDFATVRHLAHRIAVMYFGRVIEEGTAAEITESPTHPYTQALLSAVPAPNPDLQRSRQRTVLHGDLPDPLKPPTGCRFRNRCPVAMDACATQDPPLLRIGPTRRVACLRHQPTAPGPAVVGAPDAAGQSG